MPSLPYSDYAALQGLFQESMSPITNYSQGVLNLALADRARRQQAEYQMRESALVADRQQKIEQMRLAGEQKREEYANARMAERLKMEHEFKTTDEKEQERRRMVEQANEYGANLPTDTSYDTAMNAWVKARGKTYIELNRRAGQAVRDIIKGTGQDPKEFSQRIANEIANDPMLATKLTPAERENIRNHPEKMDEIRATLAKTPKKYEAFAQASQAAVDKVSLAMEKEHAAKPEVQVATAMLRNANDAMAAEFKRGGFSPQDEAEAQKVFREVVYPPQPAAPPRQAPPLPPPPVQTGPLPGSYPAVPVSPAVQSRLSSQITPEDFPYLRDQQLFTQPQSISGLAAQPLTPAGPTDPAVLAKLRLQRALQDQASQNSQFFPQQTGALPIQ